MYKWANGEAVFELDVRGRYSVLSSFRGLIAAGKLLCIFSIASVNLSIDDLTSSKDFICVISSCCRVQTFGSAY